MPVFSRPTLEDFQFKQPTGAVLTLSGLTHIATPTGLTLSTGGTGGQVTITASGASSSTDGYVLTYDHSQGVIRLTAGGGSGSTTTFDTHRPTTRSGVPSVCVGGSCTLDNFLEGYFFPAVGPGASISVATGGASREFGDAGYGNLNYSATKETNEICLVAVNDNAAAGYNNIILSAPIPGDCSGSVAYTYPGTCPVPPSGTSQTSVSYGVCVQDTAGCTSTSPASISWRNKKFNFKSVVLYTDGTISGVLSGGELSTTIAKTLSNQVFNNEFFYYVYPSSFGTPSFTVNGLPNNAWGNAGTGTLFKIDYTNSQAYLNQYYVARSDSRITGTYNIVIS